MQHVLRGNSFIFRRIASKRENCADLRIWNDIFGQLFGAQPGDDGFTTPRMSYQWVDNWFPVFLSYHFRSRMLRAFAGLAGRLGTSGCRVRVEVISIAQRIPWHSLLRSFDWRGGWGMDLRTPFQLHWSTVFVSDLWNNGVSGVATGFICHWHLIIALAGRRNEPCLFPGPDLLCSADISHVTTCKRIYEAPGRCNEGCLRIIKRNGLMLIDGQTTAFGIGYMCIYRLAK